jgi:two-component system OmpR family response regulator
MPLTALPPATYPSTPPARSAPPGRISAAAPSTIVIVGDTAAPCAARAQALSALAFRVITACNTAAAAQSHVSRTDLFLVEGHRQFAANHQFYRKRQIAQGARTIVIGDSGCPETRILTLDLGADDVVADNCSTRELWARIKAVLKLHRPRVISGGGPRYLIEAVGEFAPKLMTLRLPDGSALPLNRFENALLRRLAEAPGGTVSRNDILDALPANLPEVFDRSVDQNVRRLRRRLASFDLAGLIETCPRGGYRLDAEVRRLG